MKRKIVWGKVKHSCYFSAKTSLKFVSSKNKIRVSFFPVFHIAPSSPMSQKCVLVTENCVIFVMTIHACFGKTRVSANDFLTQQFHYKNFECLLVCVEFGVRGT
jgi:hypothetical protein